MNDVAIKATNLVKKFGDFVAVDHLSFEVNKGEIFGFLGPNGAGKTTTIRMLCTLSSPTEGSATVAGFDIAHQGNRVREHIGLVSEKMIMYLSLIHISEPTRLGMISYAVFCLKKKKKKI